MRINREIRADKVRLIGKDGEHIGVMSLRDALTKAESEGLDLVEMSPEATPPVCKIIDYGKFRYQQLKKEKESKKSQHQVKVKELKFKPNIDEHDYQTKIKHAREILLKQNKVRVSCIFKGRELLHIELGEQLVQRLCDDLSDISQAEAPPKMLGRTITTVLAPISKKRSN